ncbi:MAG: glycosyltransferase family 4 protein [Candidatus Sericytochromatia bacterium]|nr:glycosyltransferase family 4 protein [Candidatus Sericytochromatia bacterium]
MNLALLSPMPPPSMGTGPHWGSEFVTIEFFKALLRYAPFEQYHFFTADMDTAQRNYEALQGAWLGAGKIELHHVWHLPEVLARTPIHALHTTNNYLHRAVYGRTLVPGATFPVTASAFQSLTFHGGMPEYGQDLVCGSRPGDRIAVMSDAMATVMGGYYDQAATTGLQGWSGPKQPPELRTIYPGIDVERMRPVPKSDWRSKLHLPDEAFVVLSLSRLSPSDKTDMQPILRSFRDYLANEPAGERPVYLVITGSDYANYGAAVLRWVQEYGLGERVRGLGNPPEAEKAALLSAADCFISLPDNPQEAFGYSVLEAMACGVPIVAADWDGHKETVTEDVGFRVPTVWGPAMGRLDEISPLYWYMEATVMQLAAAQSVAIDLPAAWRAVERLRQDPGLARTMGAAARARAVAHFAWPTIIAQYVAMWAGSAALAAAAPLVTAPTMRWPIAFDSAYRHYASRWLDGAARVLATASAVDADLDSPYETVSHLIVPVLARQILALASSAVSLDSLIASLGQRPDTVYYHVLWLLKQGYLALDAA